MQPSVAAQATLPLSRSPFWACCVAGAAVVRPSLLQAADSVRRQLMRLLPAAGERGEGAQATATLM